VVVNDASATGDDHLDEALRRVAAARSKRAHVVLSGLGKPMRSRLVEHLWEQGRLEPSRKGLAGVVPMERWTTVDAQQAGELERRLREILVLQLTPAPGDAAIISVLHAVKAVDAVLGDQGVERHVLRRRAQAIAQDDPVADVVRQALDAAAF
jgi:hypothetical protein